MAAPRPEAARAVCDDLRDVVDVHRSHDARSAGLASSAAGGAPRARRR
jgi:hypothetical protein